MQPFAAGGVQVPSVMSQLLGASVLIQQPPPAIPNALFSKKEIQILSFKIKGDKRQTFKAVSENQTRDHNKEG